MKLEQYQTGDLFICSGTSEISNTIKLATGSAFSHTAQCLWINEELYIIEAQKEGIVMYPFRTWVYKFNYTFLVYRNPNVKPETDWSKNAMQYLGIGYDKKGLVHGLAKNILKQLVEKVSKKIVAEDMPLKYRDNGLFWCSEYTMKLVGVKNPEDYSPKLVYEYCVKNKFIKL